MTETAAVYKQIMTTLAVAGRSAEKTQVLAAIVALLDASRDLVQASGMLWHCQHNLSDVLRAVADEMDEIRESERPTPLLETLKETIASARPRYTH